MTKRKSKLKRRNKRKKSLFSYCMACGWGADKFDDSDTNRTAKSNSSLVKEKPELIVTYEKRDSCLTLENGYEENQKLEQISDNLTHCVEKETNINLEKEEKDRLVRTILCKYLEMKTAETKPQEEPPVIALKESVSKHEEQIRIENFSSGTSGIVFVENSLSTLNVSNCKIPIKSKSAPTTSEAHDSLVEICNRIHEIKHQESISETFIFPQKKSKKKLELIFTRSLNEIKRDMSSALSLQYKISCAGSSIVTGTLLTDESDGQNVNKSKESHLEGGDYSRSSGSLKWKLIISHHADSSGDFRQWRR